MQKRIGVITGAVLCLLLFGVGFVAGYVLFNKSIDNDYQPTVLSVSTEVSSTILTKEWDRYRQRMEKRTGVIIGAVLCLMLFGVGLVAGYFLFNKSTSESDAVAVSVASEECSTTFTRETEKYRASYLAKSTQASCYMRTCNSEDLPRHFVAQHLNGKTVNIDGKLDDSAWDEVPWSDSFMDTRGPDYPEPYFDSKFKIRWDDEKLYIGARLQQTDIWGTFTKDDDQIWQENSLEIYILPDGSMKNYKYIAVNVQLVVRDALVKSALIDGRSAELWWSSKIEKATYTDGVFNDPNGKGTFWSLELALPFGTLDDKTKRNQPQPEVNEAWFINFARPEYRSKIVAGKYVKDEAFAAEWWSWQPHYTINNHIPTRFGLVQFKKDISETVFDYDRWHIYKALIEVFEAEHKYKSVNGMYIEELMDLSLHMAPKILSSDCVDISVTVTATDFEATVTSRLDANLPVGHIRADRYIWFT